MLARHKVHVLSRKRHDAFQVCQSQRSHVTAAERKRKPHDACPGAKLQNARLCEQVRLSLQVKDERACLLIDSQKNSVRLSTLHQRMPRDATCISVHTHTQFQTTPAMPCWLRFCWMVIVAATRCEPSPLLVLTKIGMKLSGALALTKSMPRRGGARAAVELLSDDDAGGKRSVQSMSQCQVVLYCIARQAHTATHPCT